MALPFGDSGQQISMRIGHCALDCGARRLRFVGANAPDCQPETDELWLFIRSDGSELVPQRNSRRVHSLHAQSNVRRERKKSSQNQF
jgi:hypothetical protein